MRGPVAGAIGCAGGAGRLRPALLPAGKRIQIHVAVGACAQPGAAKGGQTCIECVTEGAEVPVAGIAERQHREAHVVEARRIRTVQLRPQRLCGIRGIAVAIGAGDHQQRAGTSQRSRRRLGGVDHARCEAARARMFGGLARQRLRGAGLGREHHRQRTGRHRRGRLLLGRSEFRPAEHARQVAVQPDPLRDIERRLLRHMIERRVLKCHGWALLPGRPVPRGWRLTRHAAWPCRHPWPVPGRGSSALRRATWRLR